MPIISAIDHAAASSNPNIRIAIVATNLQFQALAKLYVFSPLNVYPTEIFMNTGDARSWISTTPLQADFRKHASAQP